MNFQHLEQSRLSPMKPTDEESKFHKMGEERDKLLRQIEELESSPSRDTQENKKLLRNMRLRSAQITYVLIMRYIDDSVFDDDDEDIDAIWNNYSKLNKMNNKLLELQAKSNTSYQEATKQWSS